MESSGEYLDLFITRCVFCVTANFPSSVAAAVRAGRPIVQANKGHGGHLHFHKSFLPEGLRKQAAHRSVWCGSTLKLVL